MTSSYGLHIEAHYARMWGDPRRRLRWMQGPMAELPPEFCVNRYQRSADMDCFATRCMSLEQDESRLELHTFTRRSDPDGPIVEMLTVVAHYHRTGHRLDVGHSVNIGRPWLPGSRCSHGLLSLPYLDGPRLEISASPAVRCLWLIPVTPAEVAFKKANGLEALEALFEERAFDFLDPHRASVV